MKVYFIQDASGCIKIGWSSDVTRRITNLQEGCSSKLELLATLSGGASLEAHLHDTFENDRVTGEWFSPSADLLKYIEMVKSRGDAALPVGFKSDKLIKPKNQIVTDEEIIEQVREFLLKLLGRRRFDETMDCGLRRVARQLGMTHSRVKSCFYTEARKITAAEYLTIKAFVERKELEEDQRAANFLQSIGRVSNAA